MNCADCKREVDKEETYYILIADLLKVDKENKPKPKSGETPSMVLCECCGQMIRDLEQQQILQ